MKTTEINYLDGEVTISEEEPSTIEECIELIGETAVVDETHQQPALPQQISSSLQKGLGQHERDGRAYLRAVKETKTNKDGTEKKILVSEMDHLRACYTQSKEGSEAVAAAIGKHALSEPLYVKGERTGGGGKVSQAAMDAANGFFAQSDEVVEEKILVIEGQVPGYKVAPRDADGAATPRSLARGIMMLQRHLMKQAQAAALTALR